MVKYKKEFIILIFQLFMFYIFPLFSGPTDIMGMVFIIWLSTIILGIILAAISTKRIKYLFPLIITILFIPSVFIYYNESAFVHLLWYFLSSCIGLLFGMVISKFLVKNN